MRLASLFDVFMFLYELTTTTWLLVSGALRAAANKELEQNDLNTNDGVPYYQFEGILPATDIAAGAVRILVTMLAICLGAQRVCARPIQPVDVPGELEMSPDNMLDVLAHGGHAHGSHARGSHAHGGHAHGGHAHGGRAQYVPASTTNVGRGANVKTRALLAIRHANNNFLRLIIFIASDTLVVVMKFFALLDCSARFDNTSIALAVMCALSLVKNALTPFAPLEPQMAPMPQHAAHGQNTAPAPDRYSACYNSRCGLCLRLTWLTLIAAGLVFVSQRFNQYPCTGVRCWVANEHTFNYRDPQLATLPTGTIVAEFFVGRAFFSYVALKGQSQEWTSRHILFECTGCQSPVRGPSDTDAQLIGTQPSVTDLCVVCRIGRKVYTKYHGPRLSWMHPSNFSLVTSTFRQPNVTEVMISGMACCLHADQYSSTC